MSAAQAAKLKSTNLRAIEAGIDAIRRRLIAELEGNPSLFGSVSIHFQVSSGSIDRYRVTADETMKCTPSA